MVIACATVLYTVIGGLKAVIYTDTVQWIILLSGLLLVTVPFTLARIGGFGALRAALPEHFFLPDGHISRSFHQLDGHHHSYMVRGDDALSADVCLP